MRFSGHWPKRLLRFAGELLLVVVVLLAAERWMTRDVERDVPLVLEATTVDGASFNLQQWRGHSGIVYFWADWCPVCHANRPVIATLARNHPVITVAMQSGSSREVAAYMQKEQITFPVIADESGEISRRLHISGVPVALIVDETGTVRYVARGYTTELGLLVRLWLAS